jgi:hypothetical protein
VTPIGFESYTFKVNGTSQDITTHANGVYDLDGHIIIYGVETTVSRKGNEGGWTLLKASLTNAVLKVKLTSTSDPGSGWFTVWASCESARTAAALTSASGATAEAFSQVGQNAVKKVASGESGEEIHNPSSFQPGKDLTVRVYVSTWTYSGGVYWHEAALVARTAVSEALASSPGGLGNYTVASAVASAQHRVIMANASGPDSRRVAGQLSPGFGGWADVQVRNTSDVLLHHYDNFVESGGEFDFAMGDFANGTYWLYVTIEGSLRKKVVVSYTTDGVEEQGVTLIMGDTDGSNSVNIADALYTYSKIGAASTD